MGRKSTVGTLESTPMRRVILSEFSWLFRCLWPSQRPSSWLENKAQTTKQKSIQGPSDTAHWGIPTKGPSINTTTNTTNNCSTQKIPTGRRSIKQQCHQSHYCFLLPAKSGRICKTKKVRVIQGKSKRLTRMVQFSLAHIGFFKNGKILPQWSPPENFKPKEQKNGKDNTPFCNW